METASAAIPMEHPLHQLFQQLTRAGCEQVQLLDPDMITYMSNMQIKFALTDSLFLKVDGARLLYLSDLQTESQKGDTIHSRMIQQHIGDYALFIVGMFPESLERPRRPRLASYYVSQGKQAYATVSELDQGRPTSALFEKLSNHFEVCVEVLRFEKEILDSPFYRYILRQFA